MCVCVCVSERERERESARARTRRERERKRENERERERPEISQGGRGDNTPKRNSLSKLFRHFIEEIECRADV